MAFDLGKIQALFSRYSLIRLNGFTEVPSFS